MNLSDVVTGFNSTVSQFHADGKNYTYDPKTKTLTAPAPANPDPSITTPVQKVAKVVPQVGSGRD